MNEMDSVSTFRNATQILQQRQSPGFSTSSGFFSNTEEVHTVEAREAHIIELECELSELKEKFPTQADAEVMTADGEDTSALAARVYLYIALLPVHRRAEDLNEIGL